MKIMIFLLWPFSNLNHSSERVYGLKITVQNASQSTQVFTYYKWNKNVLIWRPGAKGLMLLRLNSIALGAKRPWTVFLFADYCSFAVHSYSPTVIVWTYMLCSMYYSLVGSSSSNLLVDVRPLGSSLVTFRGWRQL